MQNRFELAQNELDILIEILPKSGVIFLCGDLASGKTTLARKIIQNIDKNHEVNSPTFSLMQQYGDIYHYDLYMSGCDGIIQNGLFENLFTDGLHLVEWGDEKLKSLLLKYKLKVCIVNININENKRIYEVSFA